MFKYCKCEKVMKKLFLLLTVVLLTTACSSEDPVGDNGNIVGYWKCTGISLHRIESANPESTKKVERDLASESGTDWTFEPGGICYEHDWDDMIEFSYKIKGNILERVYKDDYMVEPYTCEFRITGNSMVMYFDETGYYSGHSSFPGVTQVIAAFNYVRR